MDGRYKLWLCAGVAMLILAACGGKEEREKAHMKRAIEYQTAKKFDKAAIEFKNALQINPKNVQARFALGRIYEQQGKWAEAYKTYSGVLSEKPDHLGANLRLARFHLLTANMKAATSALQTVLKIDPKNAQALALRAEVSLRDGNFSAALKDATAAKAVDDKNLQALSVLVRAHLRLKAPEKSMALLDEAIRRDPKNVVPYLLRIAVNVQLGEQSAVDKDFNRVFELQPKQAAYRLAYARVLVRWKKTEQAQKALQAAVRLEPKNDQLKQLLVRFIQLQKNSAQAEKGIQALLAEDPTNSVYRFGLAAFYAKNQRLERAKTIYQNIIKTSQSSTDIAFAQIALARILLAEKKDAEARKLIRTVLKKNATNEDANLLVAQLEFRDRQYDKAIDRLRGILRTKPQSVAAKRLLAEAYIRTRRLDLAADTLKALLEQRRRDNAIQTRLAQVYVLQKRYDAALTEIDKVLERSAKFQTAIATKADILSRYKRHNEAIASLKDLLTFTTNKPLVYRMLGRAYVRDKNYTAAIDAFNKSIETGKIDAQLAAQLVVAYVGSKQLKEAEARILELLQKNPRTDFLQNLLGEIYVRKQQKDKAREAFAQAINFNPKSSVPYLNWSLVERSAKNYDEALKILRRGINNVSNTYVLSLALALTYQDAGNVDAAIGEYDKILKKRPNATVAINNLAALIADYRAADQKEIDRAVALMQKLRNNQSPYILDTLGWLHYRKENYAQAIDYLKRAASKAPHIAQIRYHLGMAYLKDNQKSLAKAELEKAVKNVTKDYVGLKEAQDALKRLRLEAD